MSNDNDGIPPQGQQPPAYPGAPVPPQQPAYPSAAPAPQAPVPPAPAYPGAAPQQPGYPAPAAQHPAAPQQPGYPAPAAQQPTYPGAAPAAPGYPTGAYAQPYGQPYAAPLKSNGLAIASMICGIASVMLCWVYLILPLALGLAAVIMGHISLKKIKNDAALGGKPLAITGLITGYIGIALAVIIGAFLIIAIIVAVASSNGYGY